MPFLGERHQNIFMVSWMCRRALLNWPTLRSGGVFRLRGATAISQQARAAEGLLGKMSSRSILERGLPRQDVATARFRAAGPGKISPWCVPGRRSVAFFSPHAFPKGPRTGKAPVRGNISPPCIRNGLVLARYARHASEKPRKQPSGNTPREDLAAKRPFLLRGPLKPYITGKSCHP